MAIGGSGPCRALGGDGGWAGQAQAGVPRKPGLQEYGGRQECWECWERSQEHLHCLPSMAGEALIPGPERRCGHHHVLALSQRDEVPGS